MKKKDPDTPSHRRIPALPERPVTRPFIGQIERSYPVGRKHYSRALQGQSMKLSIRMEAGFPPDIRANLITSINSNGFRDRNTLPFILKDKSTLLCEIIPGKTGIHSFRVEFSVDGGQTWIRDNVPDAIVVIDPPQVDGLLLYTLIPNVSGTISDWKNDLERIRNMGFNAVHLLPVTTLDSSGSPYSAHDFFSIDSVYLDPDSGKDGLQQIEEFIAEAKRLGIRLCFDIVLNHVGCNSLMVKHAPDWIVPDEDQPDGFERAGYWDENGWSTWDDLVLINYEHPSEIIRSEIWAYMSDYALFWAKYAAETGGFLRFDNLHSSHPGFILSITDAIRSEFPGLAILAEFFTDESTLLSKSLTWGLNLNLATPWNYKFVPQLREYLKMLSRLSRQIRFYMPVSSHDSGTPEQEFGTASSTIPRYVAAALMGSGATGITQGVEYAEKEKI
ncbi:MAG: alpha-amylase family glycosyl hydrolase, partial [Bacteroidota bacterium]